MRLATRFYARLNVAELVGIGRGPGRRLPARPRRRALDRRRDRRRAALRAPLRPVQHRARPVDDAQRALAALARLVGIAPLEPPPTPADRGHPRQRASALRGVSPRLRRRATTCCTTSTSTWRRASASRSSASRARARRRWRRSSPASTRRRRARSRSAAPSSPRSARGDAPRRRARHPGGARLRRPAGRRPAAGRAGRDRRAARRRARARGRARLVAAAARRAGDRSSAPAASTLTAAQAQQVALARLALADPLVAVLDEATAEAGSAGARELEAAADRVLAGRTALVVAHRLTQAARADRIVVLERRPRGRGRAPTPRCRRGRHLRRALAAWSADRVEG